MGKPKSRPINLTEAPDAFPNSGVFNSIDAHIDAHTAGMQMLVDAGIDNYDGSTANGTQPKFTTPKFANGGDIRNLSHPADKGSDPYPGGKCC